MEKGRGGEPKRGKGRERDDNGEGLGQWWSMAEIGVVVLARGGAVDGEGSGGMGSGSWQRAAAEIEKKEEKM